MSPTRVAEQVNEFLPSVYTLLMDVCLLCADIYLICLCPRRPFVHLINHYTPPPQKAQLRCTPRFD